MPGNDDIHVQEGVVLPAHELQYEFSRSSGPGGQNVNKVETKVDLLWYPSATGALTEAQRERVLRKLAHRIDNSGALRLSSQEHRSREANRRAAQERLAELLREALHVDPPRRPTKPTRASRRRRVEQKRQRSQRKQLRRKPEPGDA